ncbi:MAG: hypothetical protein MUC62_07810 [Candidatus Thermoplasmatota archaeon]|nr:hypothetical protein [Candidatus Thermoplasmatota archaeon]
MSVLVVLLLSVPLPLLGSGEWEDDEKVSKVNDDGPVAIEDRERVLSDEEVRSLGLEVPDMPSRSEPWDQWERYHYHRGGESGLAVYHAQGNRIFVYGGGSHSWNGQQNVWSHSAYDDFFYYDLATNKWISIERTKNPGARVSFSYAVDEGHERFYIYGGFKDGSMANDLWFFNMSSMEWKNTIFGGFTVRRSDAPMVIDTTEGTYGRLYVHMGKDDDPNDQFVDNLTGFYKIDLDAPGYTISSLEDGWDHIARDGLQPRFEHSMCIDESSKTIYLWGGMNRSRNYLREFWSYSIVSNTWTELTVDPAMSLLYGAQLFYRSRDKTVYLFGGRNATTGLTVSNYLFGYSTESNTWSLKGTVNRINGRLLFANHYSNSADRFVASGGRYYYSGWGGQATATQYRDLNYLDLSTMRWTAFPNNVSYSSVSNGIFALDKAKQRLWYVGPNTAQNGSAYTYYWDILDRNWKGLIYNKGTEQPGSRSSAGFAFDEKNLTVYMFGGGFTQGQFPNTRYYDRADLWKIDLRTQVWTKLFDTAGAGKQQGFDMVYSPNDGNIYFFGGGFHPTESSDLEAKGDLFRFNPNTNSFTKMPPVGTVPVKRYAAGLVMVPDMNGFFMLGGEDPNVTNNKQYRELWFYDIGKNSWTPLRSVTSPLNFPKLDYDPLVKELLLTGGDDSIIQRYRILENVWYIYDPDINPGIMSGNAHYFDAVNRDLWVYAGGAKSGIWKMGIPKRLAIQNAYFKDPESGKDVAYAMYRPYSFGTTVKMVASPNELSRITFDLSHRKGSFVLYYNYTEDKLGNDAWTESDPGDYAELVGIPTVTWDGLFATVEVRLLFHWNFSSKGNKVDRTLLVRANGINVAKDQLLVPEVLTVMNQVELTGELKVSAAVQGNLTEGDWVRASENLTFTGPMVRYKGVSKYPPVGTYTLSLWEEDERKWDLVTDPGIPIGITLSTSGTSERDMTYTLNFTGTNPESEVHNIQFNVSIDGELPSAPSYLVLHADSKDDSRTLYDNDKEVFLGWQGSREDLSGLKTYYWAFTDGGLTRLGTAIGIIQETVIEVPTTGTNTVYVWAEDKVGNIGPAESKSILIDEGPAVFRVLSPDLNLTIPYQTITLEVNITDLGGSKIISQTIQYRLTNDGQNNVDMWTGAAAWKDLSELHTNFQKESFQFLLKVGQGKLPKLNDHEENFVQFRCRDGAGSDYESQIFNIKVDTSLRFPMVRLLGPLNGTVFTRADDIQLTWETDFFLPGEVSYKLYISRTKSEVVNHMAKASFDVFATDYRPVWATHGTYYWTVIPAARGEVGNTTNGIFNFQLDNRGDYDFKVTDDTDGKLKVQVGKGSNIKFQILNEGQETSYVRPVFEQIPQVRNTSWDMGDRMSPQNELIVNPTEEVELIFSFDIPLEARTGTYNMSFTFTTQRSISKQVNITLELTPADEIKPPVKEPLDPTFIIIGAIISVILLLAVLGIIYLFVIKKKPKSKLSDEQLENKLDNELVVGRDRSFGLAPAPQGLRGQTVTKSRVRTGKLDGAPVEDEDIPEIDSSEVEEVKLVEETSEDSWMNVVAAETVEMTGEDGVVESKVADDSKGKSLSDLLSEMAEDADVET